MLDFLFFNILCNKLPCFLFWCILRDVLTSLRQMITSCCLLLISYDCCLPLPASSPFTQAQHTCTKWLDWRKWPVMSSGFLPAMTRAVGLTQTHTHTQLQRPHHRHLKVRTCVWCLAHYTPAFSNSPHSMGLTIVSSHLSLVLPVISLSEIPLSHEAKLAPSVLVFSYPSSPLSMLLWHTPNFLFSWHFQSM